MTQGVIQKSNWGVPPCVIQEDKKKGKQADAAWGTGKAAFLRGDPCVSNVIVVSVYDQKPFYMISSVAKNITWVEVERKDFSPVSKEMINFKFLQFSMSHSYNYQMNDNDIADQLCLVYWLMRFSHNQKWWWALWLWGVEVSKVMHI